MLIGQVCKSGGDAMKRFCGLAAILALTGLAAAGPAFAAPPTVQPSPGYDARLQEQRMQRRGPRPYFVPPPHRRHPHWHRRPSRD
jgi:hypothetical protein